MSVYITGCEKEKNMLPETQNDKISTRSVTNEQPTQEEIAIAKQLFYLQIQNVASTPEEDKGPLMNIWKSFVPSWKTGEVIVKTNYRLMLFPTFTGVDESNYKLAFFINDNNDAALGLIGYERTNLNNPESFTGKIYQITNDGYTANEILIKNNLPVGCYYSHTNIKYFNQNSNELEFRGGDGINNWIGINNYWQYFFGDQKDVLDSDDDEGEGSSGIRINHNLPTIGCYAACPNGYSYKNCKHPRDCEGLITGCESAQEVFPNCECIETPTSIKIICDGGDDGDDDDIIIPINDDDLDNDDGLTTGGGGGGGHKKTLEDIISEITQNSEIYESCEGEVDPETNASFNPMFEYQEFLNFSADELLSMWGNNTAEALVNAILSSDGDLANSIYSQPKQQDGLEYDQDNPVHQAALQAVQALLANINSAGSEDACSSIMKMSDFANLLNELLKKEKEKLCTDNLNTFISKYNLDLTQEQKDEVLYNTNVSCGDDDQEKFDEEALEYLGLAGPDYYYDEDFWSNPDLQFDHQELPTWADFNAGFPKEEDGRYMIGADRVYKFVGGDVWNARLSDPDRTINTCALKVSIALNAAGIIIPEITTTTDKPGTLKGADGKYYFLNARSLKDWMVLTFGTDESVYKEFSEDDIPTDKTLGEFLNNDHGIIFALLSNSNVSGHADIFDGTSCPFRNDCYVDEDNHFWRLD